MTEHLYVATRKGLFTFAWDGIAWKVAQTAFLGDPVLIVHAAKKSNMLYAALGHGHFGVKLHRSDDRGKTWTECAAPEYPAPPDGTEDKCPNRQIPIPWRTEMIWAMADGNANGQHQLWCGTVPGGLFRSNDHGDSWELNRSLWDNPLRRQWFGGGLDFPGIHSICVDPRDNNRLFAGVSCGGVWLTEDGGDTWTTRTEGMFAAYMPDSRKLDPSIQDPHCVAMCRNEPDTLWVQHHNGAFRTTDGGKQWTELKDMEPSNFGFAVAAHPENPQTAWFVPAIKDELRIPVDGKLVVTRTTDGGRSFDVLRNGLPQEHAYDITFRHAMDVCETGCSLAFGTTTGSLFLSGNAGDDWTCAHAHLPPVYCVRFG